MSRNLYRRVELLFPIEEPSMIDRIKSEVLDTALSDTSRARELRSDGSYKRVAPREEAPAMDSQYNIMLSRTKGSNTRVTVPRESPPSN